MPISLSTWKHGLQPNQITFDKIISGGSALDAVELGARYCEADLTCMSVGRGGIPDELGQVTLDASIMDHEGNCGSVAFVRNYEHVASIARRVMEKTPHVMLAGEGAERFAEREGFPRTDLLTEKAKALWEEWRKAPDKLHIRLRRAGEGEDEYSFVHVDDEGRETELNRDDIGAPRNVSHDTIGIIARDSNGHLAGACTTSGLAFKMHGRVGDSPIIGAGLYVDGKYGAAVATGNGELVMRACSSFFMVEMMREGAAPEEACKRAIERLSLDRHIKDDMQVGLMVIRADGKWATRSLRPGFQFALASDSTNGSNILQDAVAEDSSPIKNQF
jgi:isoaspartyl peptidase/L-asparaginase-like protein (Ntn-hydrolase superfamily)